MYTFFTVIIIIVCALLILVVLIQNPKGGGLSAAFGGISNQFLGAKRSTDYVEKATWYLAVALIVLSLSTFFFSGTATTQTPQSNNPLDDYNSSGNSEMPFAPSGSEEASPESNPEQGVTPESAPQQP